LATSVDGRRFSFQASLYGLQLQAGGYVVLEDGGTTRLGQVITLDLGQLSTELMLSLTADGGHGNRTQMLIRYVRGEGVILEGDFATFHDATVRVATGTEVRAWLGRTVRPDAKLQLGELALATGVPCAADAGGFNRHTFLCGAVSFHQGEALIAGKISPQPALLRFGARISEEGGADVPATWASARRLPTFAVVDGAGARCARAARA